MARTVIESSHATELSREFDPPDLSIIRRPWLPYNPHLPPNRLELLSALTHRLMPVIRFECAAILFYSSSGTRTHADLTMMNVDRVFEVRVFWRSRELLVSMECEHWDQSRIGRKLERVIRISCPCMIELLGKRCSKNWSSNCRDNSTVYLHIIGCKRDAKLMRVCEKSEFAIKSKFW